MDVALRRECDFVFQIDLDLLKKTFSAKENEKNFRHNHAQYIKLFPFISGRTKGNTKKFYSFSSAVGEWLRLASGKDTQAKSMEDSIDELIASVDDIDSDEKKELRRIIQKIYWTDDEKHALRLKNITAMCYIPCEDMAEKRIAQYLYSVLGNHNEINNIVNQAKKQATDSANVLEETVLKTLGADVPKKASENFYYTVHLAPQKCFTKDLQFILGNPARTREYLVDLLDFYYFFYTSQTILTLDRFQDGNRNQVVPLYFSLDWEKTNKARNCYGFGWQRLQKLVKQQFCHAVTLELLNQNPTNERFDYIALKEYTERTNQKEKIAGEIRKVCDFYRQIFSEELEELKDLKMTYQGDPVFAEVHYLYDNVKTLLENTSRHDVVEKYARHFENFCKERFLKSRGASGLMLNITEEFLIFLTKLAIQNQEKMRLNEVFRQFECRGVFLDQSSRDEVLQFYTKLNLIEKKSDSGDAQYVRKIL